MYTPTSKPFLCMDVKHLLTLFLRVGDLLWASWPNFSLFTTLFCWFGCYTSSLKQPCYCGAIRAWFMKLCAILKAR